ncbi:glutaredoxin family protein [Pandoraea anhela]|uniref:Glutaredoxin-like protein NrdH n=1 Tax=Pandoraea anhela TaxID=2508295 RepID=A0A5E4W793_9BURK|nr:glutaredoxin family protein [Pandoraea anhela]VVE20582.1 Glutaredoxin-like protein NrdH [Pandoraea anhela]
MSEALRVYWQPGCSSCVKVKELLAQLNVPFEAINIQEQPDAFRELAKRGIRSVPVLIRGDESIFGQSLNDVAAFVGKKLDHQRLPVPELFQRWTYFLNTARGLIAQIPDELIDQRPVAERDRTYCQLSYHIFQIADSFLLSVEEGMTDTREVTDAVLDHIRTVPDLLTYADPIIARHARWWEKQADKHCEFNIETYYGPQDAATVIERSTWHTAQHVRQLDHVLGAAVPGVKSRVNPEMFVGLPIPQALWQ